MSSVQHADLMSLNVYMFDGLASHNVVSHGTLKLVSMNLERHYLNVVSLAFFRSLVYLESL